jgi:hypothetical protein
MHVDYYYQNIVLLHPSDEAEQGSGGDQPARNSLTGWNGKKGAKYPPATPAFLFQPDMPQKTHCFVRSKKTDLICYTKNKLKNQSINLKKGQRISGQDRLCKRTRMK